MGCTVHGILQARILEWVVMPSSKWSSQPRDWTQASCIAGRFSDVWATREAQEWILEWVKVKVWVWLFETLYSPWNSSGLNIGVDSLSLLQGIFPTQGSNIGLLHCRRILYQLSHKGSPRILEWVAFPFFRGSSQPRNWTRVSCIAGRFLYQLSYQGSLLEWVAYPFSMGYSWPRNQTRVSCVAGRFFTRWATREALIKSNR